MMKKKFPKTLLKIFNFSPAVLISSLLVVGCTTENKELELDFENELSTTSSSYATPEVGGTYTLTCAKSGRVLSVLNGNNSNGADVVVSVTNANTTATQRQWEVISVGDDYVRLRCVDSQKSLEISGGSNSNGANAQQWAYQGTTHQEWEILSVGDGYYRLKSRDSGKSLRCPGDNAGSSCDQWAYNGWDSQKFFFTEVDGGGGTVTPPTTGGDTPGAILGLTNNDWKLNGFVDTPSASATYYDDVMDHIDGNIATWSNSNYFYAENGWAYFKCYRGLGSSDNSGNPRVELRELTGGNLATWDGDDTNSMQFDVRVDQLPVDADNDGGVLCFAQIHGPGNTIDDLIRLQFIGDSNQSSGEVRLKISGYITEEVRGGSLTLSSPTYNLDTAYTFKIEYTNGVVRVYEGGTEIFEQEMDISDLDGNYWKLGNYLQSVQGASFTGSYGLVGLRNLTIVP